MLAKMWSNWNFHTLLVGTYSHFGKLFGSFSYSETYICSMTQQFHPQMFPPRRIKICVQKKYARIFTIALFIYSRKQLKSPSTEGWVKNNGSIFIQQNTIKQLKGTGDTYKVMNESHSHVE